MSSYENLLVVGTQLGRVDIWDYFNPVLRDYQIIHSSEVLGLELVHDYKESRISGDLIYAGDIEDPRNKNKFLAQVFSLSQDEMVLSRFYKKFDKA